MNVSTLKYFEYAHPFVSPLQTASGSIDSRRGIVVKLIDTEGQSAFGEIAPLEILNMTPINECVDQLENIKQKLAGKNDIEGFILNNDLAPEVVFGLEQALESLKLMKNRNSSPPAERKSISINALLGLEDEEELVVKTGRLIAEGYSTIKIKIDNNNPDGLLKAINRLDKEYGDAIKIRLDANKALNYDQALKILSQLNSSFIEYVEDPVGNISDMIKLQENAEVNIAMDEFITPQNVQEMLDISSINYYVIKPMKFGFYNTIKIIKSAESKYKSIVISSMFESAVGRSALVYLAAMIKGGQAHGLDTAKYLAADIDDNIYPCDKPKADFIMSDYPPEFNLGDMPI